MSSSLLLLDTNILLAYLRGKGLGKHIKQNYPFENGAFDSLVSVISIGEIYSLARKLKWGTDKVNQMHQVLDGLVTVSIDSPDILSAYADLDYFCENAGRKMGKNDLWIAATAKVSGATLLTTDLDFDHLHESKLINRIWIDEAHGKTP